MLVSNFLAFFEKPSKFYPYQTKKKKNNSRRFQTAINSSKVARMFLKIRPRPLERNEILVSSLSVKTSGFYDYFSMNPITETKPKK